MRAYYDAVMILMRVLLVTLLRYYYNITQLIVLLIRPVQFFLAGGPRYRHSDYSINERERLRIDESEKQPRKVDISKIE